mmetsp:Transcript_23584/g.42531  ORF Transcript_23584/g.42531 Transcript_23584/m.42531 type:complete len:431 (-) Transcript_23584:51-1343(-)
MTETLTPTHPDSEGSSPILGVADHPIAVLLNATINASAQAAPVTTHNQSLAGGVLAGNHTAPPGNHSTSISPHAGSGQFSEADVYHWALMLCGLVAALAAFLSLRAMDKHIRYNKHAIMRAYVVRILFMVPIYAMTAWLGLVQKEYAMWWDLVREVYEAFTIYAFVMFLTEYLGGVEDVKALVLARYTVGRRLMHHLWPCSKWWKEPNDPKRFVFWSKFGVFQYCVVQSTTAVLEFYLHTFNRFEKVWSFTSAYMWIVISKNISQTWALYCLVWYYHNLQHELSGCKPVPKAMCIKGVVFFTYWQSIMLSILVAAGVLKGNELMPVEEVASGLQSMIICFEMLIASIMHILFFPWDEFNNLPDRDTHLEVNVEGPEVAVPSFELVREGLILHSRTSHSAETTPTCGSDVQPTQRLTPSPPVSSSPSQGGP